MHPLHEMIWDDGDRIDFADRLSVTILIKNLLNEFQLVVSTTGYHDNRNGTLLLQPQSPRAKDTSVTDWDDCVVVGVRLLRDLR
jgi:hypothetical protein